MRVILDVLEYVVIGTNDDESFAEDVDDSTDVKVLRSVERWRFRSTSGTSDTTLVQILTTGESRVAYRRLENRYHIIRQVKADDEFSTLFLLPG